MKTKVLYELLFVCLFITGISETNASGELKIIKDELPYEHSQVRTGVITHVVIHFMSNASRKPHDPYNQKELKAIFDEYGVSAHYMIGRKGEIYLLVPENRVAYHAGRGELVTYPLYIDRLNEYSIGIELLAIGTKEEMLPMVPGKVFETIDPSLIGYTNAQYISLQLLLNDILIRNPSIIHDKIHIIGHDEYALGRKTDPGSLFDWSRLPF